MGMQNVNPVSIQTAVNAYLLPFERGRVKLTNEINAKQTPLAAPLVQKFAFQIVFFVPFV